MREHFRAIPSVDVCLRTLCESVPEFNKVPHSLLRDIVAAYWDEIRKSIRENTCKDIEAISLDRHLPYLIEYVHKKLQPRLKRVLNATGVIIHTNLGRSILAQEAVEAAIMAASEYCNLELNLETGERGSRHELTEDLIRRLTGAEAALVVNNNAAAVLLILDTICGKGEVIVSRGELVEIGGSFRIPDIMTKSGTMLKEVGTTNRTHLKDYKDAINENTRAIMCVHTSNFRIIGFHAAVELRELKKLAVEHNLPLIFDLGSGNILDFSSQGLPYEPTVGQILADGADCVCFSGDKALGGPQAGIIAGRKDLIEKFKKNPLARALRCDKLCLAALEATLRLYLDPQLAQTRIPTVHMIEKTAHELALCAKILGTKIKKSLGAKQLECTVSYAKDISRVGGGTYPECNLPTTLVCINSKRCTPQQLRQALLQSSPPLIGRIEKDTFCLDPRTLNKKNYSEVADILASTLEKLDANYVN